VADEGSGEGEGQVGVTQGGRHGRHTIAEEGGWHSRFDARTTTTRP
jgi:hypothetical protein